MTEKDELKAKLEKLFAAALMEIPDEPGPANAPGTSGSASSPSITRQPMGGQVGAISQYNANPAPAPSFHGIAH